MMCDNVKNLDYSIKGIIEVCEIWNEENTKQKSLRKVAEERYLNPGNMLYLYNIILKKKKIYGGKNNCIIL